MPVRPSRARSRREFLLQAGEDGFVRLRVVDLVSRALFFCQTRVQEMAKQDVRTSVRASMPRKAILAPSWVNMLWECSAT